MISIGHKVNKIIVSIQAVLVSYQHHDDKEQALVSGPCFTLNSGCNKHYMYNFSGSLQILPMHMPKVMHNIS